MNKSDALGRFGSAFACALAMLTTLTGARTAPPVDALVDDFGIEAACPAPPYDDGTGAPIDLMHPWPGWSVRIDEGAQRPQGCDIVLLDPNEAPWSYYIDLRVALSTEYVVQDVYGYAMAPPVNELEPYEPCVDFYAQYDEFGRQLSIRFERPGIYVLCTNDASGAPTFFTVAAHAPRGGSGRGPQRDGVPKLLQLQHLPRELHTFDLILVERPGGGDNGFDEAAFNNLKNIRAPVKRITSVQQGVDAIVARFNQLERPINVLIAGHGAGGTVGMGSGQGNGNNEQDKEFIGVGSEQNGLFIRGVKGKVKGVYMFGCNVATGPGKTAMKQMARRLSNDDINCVVAGHNRLVAAWTALGNRPGGLYVYGDRRNQCDITAHVERGR